MVDKEQLINTVEPNVLDEAVDELEVSPIEEQIVAVKVNLKAS